MKKLMKYAMIVDHKNKKYWVDTPWDLECYYERLEKAEDLNLHIHTVEKYEPHATNQINFWEEEYKVKGYISDVSLYTLLVGSRNN